MRVLFVSLAAIVLVCVGCTEDVTGGQHFELGDTVVWLPEVDGVPEWESNALSISGDAYDGLQISTNRRSRLVILSVERSVAPGDRLRLTSADRARAAMGPVPFPSEFSVCSQPVWLLMDAVFFGAIIQLDTESQHGILSIVGLRDASSGVTDDVAAEAIAAFLARSRSSDGQLLLEGCNENELAKALLDLSSN
jgi:hypothetical protein